MNSLPEKIEFEALLENEPVESVLVKLVLFMNKKNNYSFIVGPTNYEGKASISKNEIINEANKTLELGIMDHASLEGNYSGKFQAEVMRIKDIERAVDAYAIYGKENYPEQYINNLNNVLSSSINIEKVEIIASKL